MKQSSFFALLRTCQNQRADNLRTLGSHLNLPLKRNCWVQRRPPAPENEVAEGIEKKLRGGHVFPPTCRLPADGQLGQGAHPLSRPQLRQENSPVG